MNAPFKIRGGLFPVRVVPPIGPTLGNLLDQHKRVSEAWTPSNDGLSFDIADEIKLRLMVGGNEPLTKAQADYLMGEVL